MIERIQKDVCRLYVNTMPLLYKGQEHPQILVSAGVLEPILGRYQGTTVHIFLCSVS